MNNVVRNCFYFVILAFAAYSIFFCCQNMRDIQCAKPAPVIVSHEWLHKELSLTDEQTKKLEQIEQSYHQKEVSLSEGVKAANKALAQVVLKDGKYSDKVKKAVSAVHMAMGELQEATLQHLFEMQTVLDAQQAQKLNQLAADALVNAP